MGGQRISGRERLEARRRVGRALQDGIQDALQDGRDTLRVDHQSAIARWRRGKESGGRLLRGICCLLLFILGAVLGGTRVSAVEFRDAFADREWLSGDSGTLEGDNTSATREAGEPRHARKPGGHSVWVAWEAPADGLLQLSTTGSSFDTILAAYRPETGASTNSFEGWEAVGSDDDDDDERSEPTGLAGVSFPVRQGQRLAIVVDGYAGAAGTIRLDWKFTARSEALPIVGAVSGDRSARPGDEVILSVAVDFAGSAEFRWFRNSEKVDDAESPTLRIRNFQREDAGRYRLQIKVGEMVLYSEDVEVQLNSEGQDAVLARNKLFDALDSRLRPDEVRGGALLGPEVGAGAGTISAGRMRLQSVAAAAPIGVVRGLNGTQIFNTRFATRDPGEPLHCGQAGGASYWFAYENVNPGRLRFDTSDSAVDTVLAVYTYDGVLTSYAQLQPVACDLAQAPGHPAAVTEFPAEAGRTYLVAVDSRGGARGVIHLSYLWQPSSVEPVPPPSIVEEPVSLALRVGQPGQLSAVVTGAPPVTLQWWKDGVPLSGETNPGWSVPAATLADAGDYWLVAANAGGSVTSAVARVEVTVAVPPPTLLAGPVAQRLAVGQAWELSVQATGPEPWSWQWWKDDQALLEATQPTWGSTSAVLDHAGAYWVVVSNAGGSVTSSVARVEVVAPPSIRQSPTSVAVAEGGRARLRVEWEPNPEPLTLTWRKDGKPISGATTAELVLESCTPASAGDYVVELANFAGLVRSAPARVEVVTTPQVMRLPGVAELLLCFPVAAGKNYQVEVSSAATAGWVPDDVLAADETGLLVYRHPITEAGAGFFRCVPVPRGGAAPGP